MRIALISLVVLGSVALRADAAVIVLGNYTTQEVAFTLTTLDEKPRSITIPAYHVQPVAVTGPSTLTLAGKDEGVRVDPYNAYVFIPDRVKTVRIQGLELPGKAPERDARPELNPKPRVPFKVPVTLLVDDADPRADKLWQEEVKRRFDAAAAVLNSQTGFQFEFAGFKTWESDGKARDLGAQLPFFEAGVKVRGNGIAVGYTSRKMDEGEKALGACKGMGATHILLREWKPRGEPEKIEVLVRYLAVAVGAVTSPDPGSAMRDKPGDGKALYAGFVIRLDPLNALALNLWAEQRQAGRIDLDDVPEPDRTRLLRVYSALLRAFPEDTYASDYVAILEKDPVRLPKPKNPDPNVKNDPAAGMTDKARRIEAVRTVVAAITERARANTGPAAVAGDELTAALVEAAATAVMKLEEPERFSAFLLGIAIALDDTNALKDDPLTTSAVAEIESDAERAARLAVLGNPTLRQRRDLCRRFAIGCGLGELLTPTAAENTAVNRLFADLQRPVGFSFPGLAAEFAGISLARKLRESPDLFPRLRNTFSSSDFIPQLDGLREGLGLEKFEEAYGGTDDERFRSALAAIRKRIKALPINKADQ
jgi:hypothetical protein